MPISCFIFAILNGNEMIFYHRFPPVFYVLSCPRAKVVGKFLEKVSKSNKSRRAFQVILCLAETAALRIVATCANTALESQSVWGRPLLTEHFSRDNQYIFVWKQNKEKARLGWRCLCKSCHFRFIHTWLRLLSHYIYHHMLLLLFFGLLVILILEK